MAIHEEVDEETLGGADMHSRVSGVSDYLAADERDAIRIGREIVAHLNWRKLGWSKQIAVEEADLRSRRDARPRLDRHPQALRRQRIIARIVDGSRFHESSRPTAHLVTATPYPRLSGRHPRQQRHPLLPSRPRRAASSSSSATRPIPPSCSCRTSTGFMVGSRYEQGGIIKDGAKLINAVLNSGVPHLTVMVGASYGPATTAWPAAPRPRFRLQLARTTASPSWVPSSSPACFRSCAAKPPSGGHTFDEAEDAMVKQMVQGQIEKESYAFFATARVWDDGIIDPRDTARCSGSRSRGALERDRGNERVRGVPDVMPARGQTAGVYHFLYRACSCRHGDYTSIVSECRGAHRRLQAPPRSVGWSQARAIRYYLCGFRRRSC